MRPPDPKHLARMKVRNADARLNELLAAHPNNTARRRALLKEFWLDVGTAKLRVPNVGPVVKRKPKVAKPDVPA